MSPELLDPDRFGMTDSRPTKESDCYAMGMVIYEVLSGQAPFPQCSVPVIIRKVMEGERPERPQGPHGTWVTDDLWRMVELCWNPRPYERPGLEEILRCLGGTQPLRPLSPVLPNDGEPETDSNDLLDSTPTVPGTFSISPKASLQSSRHDRSDNDPTSWSTSAKKYFS